MTSAKLPFLALFLLLSFAASGACTLNAGNNVSVCQNASLQIAATDSGVTTIVWSSSPAGEIVSGGTTLTPTINTAIPGTYTLIVTGNGGQCKDSVKVIVNPNPPVPNIALTNDNSCAGTAVGFSTTAHAGVSFSWNFGDGGSTNGTNVSHTYNPTSGGGTTNYTVTVTGTNTFGCTTSTPQIVSVKQNPTAVLSSTNALITYFNGDTTFYKCSNNGQTFSNFIFKNSSNPQSGATYTISWGDTGAILNLSAFTTISHIYGLGIYTLQLIVTNSQGCTDTAKYRVFFGSNPAGGIVGPGNTSGCSPQSFTFKISGTQNNTHGTIYTVTFNDGSSPQVFNHPPPDSIPHVFTVNSCGTTSSNGIISFNNAFSASFVAENPCGVSAGSVVPIYISLPVNPGFTISPSQIVCISTPVTFTDISTGEDIIPTGGNNTICDSIPPRVWSITPITGWNTSGVLGSTNGFVSPNFDPYSWTPGDQNLIVTFTNPGVYTINMLSGNNCGPDTVIKTICVESPPSPSFAVNPVTGCAPLIVNLTNSSTGLFQCDSVTRLWTVSQTGSTCVQDSTNPFVFISGTSLSSVNPIIRFNNQGTYTITLSLTNVCGTFTTPPQTITVNRKPVTTIAPLSAICFGDLVTPSLTSSNCGSAITAYNWSFPGAIPSTSSIVNPANINYTITGIQTISVTVTNSCGTATASTTIDVLPPPIANAGSDQQICSGNSAQLGAAPIAGLSYQWTPAAGLSSSTIANPTVTLTYSGGTTLLQQYILIVTNAAGCTDQDTVTVTVYPQATVNAGPSISTCSLLPINLAGTFGAAATSVTWSASVGGGTFTPNVHSATATYTPPNGQSTITLTLTTNDPAGPCPAASDNMVITFLAPPVANAGPNVHYCSGFSVQIGSTNQPGYTYTWSPTNGLSSTSSSNPTVVLTNNGTTVITQTYTLIVSAQGCSDTAQVVAYVYPPATVNAGAGGAVCAGSSIQLTGTIGGNATSATWSSGQGTFNPTNTLTTTFTPNITSGTATVTLATNVPAGPCPAAVSTANVTVNAIPVISLPASQTICSGSSTTPVILSSQVGGTTYTWSGNSPTGITGFSANGTASTIPSFTPINGGTAVGTINYSITPTANGCTGTPTTYTFTVNPIPVIASISPQTICSGQSTTAVSPTANIAGTSYSWSSSVTGSVTGNTPSGTTGIPLQTLTNSGTIAGTVTYSITPTVNGCPGNPANFVVTVNPLPTINAIPPQTICSGQSTTLVSPTSSVSGTTYSWSSSVIGTITGNTSNGTTSIPVQTLTNNGATSGTVTYIITPTANTCVGPTQSLVVTVNPIPHATATPSVDTICSGNAVNIQLSSTVGGTSFSWTVNAPVSITGASNGNGSAIQQTLISTSAAIQTVIYTITPSANNCNGSPITVTVYVNPSADIQFTPLNQNICSGQTTQLVTLSSTTGGATFTWNSQSNGITGVATSGTNTIPQQTLINNTNSPLIATYTANANFAGCTSQNAVYSITVNPIPTVTLPANQTVCAGSASTSVILNSPVAGATYSWSGNSPNGITGFPATGNTSSIPSFTPNNPNSTAGTINYTITPTANGCAGTPNNFTFTINPLPIVVPIPPQTLCSGQSTTLVTPTSNVSGTTYAWSSSVAGTVTGNTASGTTNIPAQTLTNSGNTAGTVTYSISPTANGCPGTPVNFVVTVNPLPTINAIPPQTVCSGQSTTLVTSTSNVSGTTYAWSSSVAGTVTGNTPSGTSSIPVQTLTNSSTIAGTVTYTITPTANTCIGPVQSFTITVNPIPQATATPSIVTICSGDIINIQLSSTVNGTSFNWTVNAPPSIIGASSGTGNSIQQTLTSTSSTRQTVTYSVTPSANGCTGSAIMVSVVVNPGVTINFSPAPQTICSGQSTQLVTLSSLTSGATIAWTSQANGVGGVALSGTTIIPVQTLTNTTNAPITVVYAATATYVGCTTQAFNYPIVVNPIPMVTNAPLSQTVCSGSSTQQINFTSQVAGATFSWTANSPNGITGFTPTGTSATIPPFVPTNPADTAGTIIITVTPTANNCSGFPATYIITVYPFPDVILPSTQTICNGDATVSVTPTSDVAGTTFSWTSAATANVTGNTLSGTGNIPAQILSNSGSTSGTVTYSIIPTANGCAGTPANYVVTINPSPTVAFTPSPQTICSGQTTQQVTISSSTPGAIITWTASVPIGIIGADTSGNAIILPQTLLDTTNNPLTITYTAQANTSGLLCPGMPSSYTITVNPIPDVIASPSFDTICSGTQLNVLLSSNVTGATFSWTSNAPSSITGANSGSGNAITDLLTNNGSNPATVIYNVHSGASGCSGQGTTVFVTVYPVPVVTFSPLSPQTICDSATTQAVQITSSTQGVTIAWTAIVPLPITGAITSGGATIPPQTLFNSSNTIQQIIYSVTVGYLGCPGLSNSYIVNVNPTAHIVNTDTMQSVCSGDATAVIALLSDVTNASFTWSTLGNSNLVGYIQNGSGDVPSQIISNFSNQAQSLVYTATPSFAGCSGVPKNFVITVNPRPVINLMPDSQSICSNTLSAPIISNSNIIGTTYSWTSTNIFVSIPLPTGTGDTIPGQNLINTSSQADTGFVWFIVTPYSGNCAGNTDTAFIQVNPTPVINFSLLPNYGCSPLNVGFTTNPFIFGSPDSLVFNWGDGTHDTAIFRNPIQPFWSMIHHTYSNTTFQPITFIVSLTGYNNCGETIVFDSLTVLPNTIQSSFTAIPNHGCEPLAVTFTNNSTGALVNSWCFNYNLVNDSCLGASLVDSAHIIQHTFSSGTYLISLYITDGCSQDIDTATITVSPSPVADFIFTDSICTNAPVTFVDHSTFPLGQFLTSYSWLFGDGDSLSGSANASHQYDSAGVYDACHTVTSSNGCYDTQCRPVTILSTPQAKFTANDTCLNTQPIQFINTSTGGNYFYQWNFGDSNTAVLQNPTHSYQQGGTYNVTLTVSTNYCINSISHPVIIHPIPDVSFTLPSTYVCGEPAVVAITNTSTTTVGTLGYSWDFGNNTTSTDVNPIATFATPGSYTITLVASNEFLCQDSVQHPITIYPFPVIQSIDIQPAEGCQPLQISITAKTTNGNLFLWNFGDGTSTVSTILPAVNYTYQDTGTYSISLIAYSFLTCGDTVMLSDTVKVHIKPVAAFDTLINSNSYPFDGTVIFINQSLSANTYQWSFGDGFNSIDTNPIHKYEAVDSFTVTLIAANNYCQDTTSKTFLVIKKALYVPNALEPNYGGSDTLVKIWKPIGIGLRDYHAQVFDKWGRLLWESTLLNETAPAESWDGIYAGIPCPEDVYVWKVDAVFIDGAIWQGMTYKKDEGGGTKRIGSITLIR